MNEHGVNPKVETQNPLKLVLPKGLLTDQQKKRRRQTSSDQDGSTFGGMYLIPQPYTQGCQRILKLRILKSIILKLQDLEFQDLEFQDIEI